TMWPGHLLYHPRRRAKPANVFGLVVAEKPPPLAVHIAALAVHARTEHQQATIVAHGYAGLGGADNFFVARRRVLVRLPMAALGAEHGNGRTAAYKAGIVGGDFERATGLELGHVARRAPDRGLD